MRVNRHVFGEYRPDTPSHLSESLAIAENVVPIENGYGPVGQFAPSGNGTLAARCMGAGAYRYNGETFIFAATSTNIYRYQTAGHTSIKSGLTTNVGMRFCPYGKFMMMTNGGDPIQKFDPGTPTTTTNLSGTAPTAKYLGVARGFLVAGYANNDPLRLDWSDTGAPTNWTAGGASLAGSFSMPSGGDITGVVGGEYGLIFQERRIVRMSFTGDDAIWQFDEISSNTGCVAPWSLVTWGRLTFFLSEKGFMVCDGTSVTPVGHEKVDRSFLSSAQISFYDQMSAAIDPVNSLYIVTLPSTNPTTKAFAFNYLLSKWSTLSLTAERIFSGFAQNYTLEELDSIYASIDAMTPSLDANDFKGGRPLLLLYDGSHRLGTLSGLNAQATIVDARREFFPGRRSRLQSVRPMTNSAIGDVLIYGRNALSDGDTTTTYSLRAGGGIIPVRQNYTFMQVGLQLPAGADWTYVQGYDADAVMGGRP